ncbi:MAG TPA: hypothetical protein VJ816_10340 [Gemmatimonadales bacterium]|nr:hypothetical protein [Gemmatimonadales bacterium]
MTRTLDGARAVANVTQQLVARAERQVDGVLAAELWQPTLPAWRRAAARATLQVRIAGEAAELDGKTFSAAPAEHPTVLLVDGIHTLLAAQSGETVSGLWSSHPLIAELARKALAGA